tara:strand:+ start:3671 stop:3976 length:306 start_codon:yes stop_codon:yes gene_type:complete
MERFFNDLDISSIATTNTLESSNTSNKVFLNVITFFLSISSVLSDPKTVRKLEVLFCGEDIFSIIDSNPGFLPVIKFFALEKIPRDLGAVNEGMMEADIAI